MALLLAQQQLVIVEELIQHYNASEPEIKIVTFIEIGISRLSWVQTEI